MSLIDDFMEDFVFMERHRVAEDEGGFATHYTEGEQFRAAVTLDTSMQARMAEQQGVKNLYTVTTPKELSLEYHEVFKRLSDGKIFRVTSDGTDKVTPRSATLNIRQVTAEQWELTT